MRREALPSIGASLSRVLVAFAIEFDNEFERRMPHRTTRHGSTGDVAHAPWLVSMAMWMNCMRFVPADGIATRELARRGRMTSTSAPMIIKRMSRWWGYLRVVPADAGTGSRLALLTPAGAQAQRVWQPLVGDVEDRWRSRFGDGTITGLRAALTPIVGDLPQDLADFPTVGDHAPTHDQPMSIAAAVQLGLPALVGRALIGYGDDLQHQVGLPVSVAANALRVLPAGGVRVGELSRLTGLAQMGIDNSLSVLTRRGLVWVESAGPGKARVVHATPEGVHMQSAYAKAVADVETGWTTRFGHAAISQLLDALECVAGTAKRIDPRLLDGTRPHPGGWRTELPPRHELPHFPLVSHRGGFPDGS